MRVIGHRGTPTSPFHPENTLTAVRAALEAGADGVEVDVRSTSDGVLVLSHDRDLGRVLGTGAGTGPVVAHTPSAELLDLELPGGTVVPTLGAVLDLAAVSGAHVLTEVKPEAGGPEAWRTARLLAALLIDRRRRLPRTDRVTTTSFDLTTAASLSGCGTVSGALVVARELDPDRAARQARERGLTDVHLSPAHVRHDRGVVARIRALGLLVGVGVLDDPAEADELAGLGVHLVCTDDPAGLARHRAPAAPAAAG
jgi:glycerophosphoryl diester phosphodiesterase